MMIGTDKGAPIGFHKSSIIGTGSGGLGSLTVGIPRSVIISMDG
jgi:hypothetical protein